VEGCKENLFGRSKDRPLYRPTPVRNGPRDGGDLLDRDGGGASFVHDFAVEEVHGALGVVGVTRVVCDHADGGAGLVDVLEQFHDGVAILRVEVAGGLIGQKNHRIANQGAGHGNTLLLTTGELGRIVLGTMSHLDALEGTLHLFLTLGGGHAAISEGEFDVLVDGEIADEVEGLEDEADFAIADARAVGELEAGDGLAVEGVVPFRGRIEEAKDGEECGFAAAGRTGDSEVLTLLDDEINGIQSVGFEFVGEEDFADALKIDERVIRGGHHVVFASEMDSSKPYWG
jgi:hypothetical protein